MKFSRIKFLWVLHRLEPIMLLKLPITYATKQCSKFLPIMPQLAMLLKTKKYNYTAKPILLSRLDVIRFVLRNKLLN